MPDRPSHPLVVLDDDPTGAQAVRDVPVLFDASPDGLRAAAGERAVHVLTNTRALAAAEAYAVTRAAAAAAASALPGAPVILRGDSTLRAHVHEEYAAVRDALHPGAQPPLLLVPALPAAGRVTLGGVHRLLVDGAAVPLERTEYARDAHFAYPDARLLAWAEHRSGGALAAAHGRELPLAALRAADGPERLAAWLAEVAGGGRAAAVVPDAETLDDLAAIAEGLRRAWARDVPVIVRSAPAFAALLAGTAATGDVPPPPLGAGLLVVCGSWVANSTRQLAALLDRHPAAHVVADVHALARGERAEEERLAAEAVRRLAGARLAVIATPRERAPELEAPASAQAIADGLARAVGAAAPSAGVVLAKGGITSHVTAAVGLGARRACVVGPLLPGISLWQVESGGRSVPYVVFPGNVGGPDALADVVDRILGA